MWVKVCGLRTAEDVDAALAAGVDAIGFVLVPSARQVSVDDARALAAHVAGRAQTVGVFRRLDPDAVAMSAAAGLDLAQGVLDGVPAGPGVLPVLADGPDLTARAAALAAPRLLVDAPDFGAGETADWRRIATLARARPVVLAGGLSPQNVGRAIEMVRPAGVDVSSGIERTRGVKDADRILAFTLAARAASAPLERT
jgi:phosphoribosylanthranilate isomerase